MNESSRSSSQVELIKKEINAESKNTMGDQKRQTDNPTIPLMRYFDLIDDTTRCYILGYN